MKIPENASPSYKEIIKAIANRSPEDDPYREEKIRIHIRYSDAVTGSIRSPLGIIKCCVPQNGGRCIIDSLPNDNNEMRIIINPQRSSSADYWMNCGFLSRENIITLITQTENEKLGVKFILLYEHEISKQLHSINFLSMYSGELSTSCMDDAYSFYVAHLEDWGKINWKEISDEIQKEIQKEIANEHGTEEVSNGNANAEGTS